MIPACSETCVLHTQISVFRLSVLSPLLRLGVHSCVWEWFICHSVLNGASASSNQVHPWLRECLAVKEGMHFIFMKCLSVDSLEIPVTLIFQGQIHI